MLHGFPNVSKCFNAKPDLFHAIHVSMEAAAHLRAMWQAASAWHSKKCLGRIWADQLDEWYFVHVIRPRRNANALFALYLCTFDKTRSNNVNAAMPIVNPYSIYH